MSIILAALRLALRFMLAAMDDFWGEDTCRCLAHSRPRPVLPPVMTYVLPERSTRGTNGLPKIWPPRYWRTSANEGMLGF